MNEQIRREIGIIEESAARLKGLAENNPAIQKECRDHLNLCLPAEIHHTRTDEGGDLMEEVKRIRTTCRSCHGGCGVIAHVREGKVVKVEGDPDSPISHGYVLSVGFFHRDFPPTATFGAVPSSIYVERMR